MRSATPFLATKINKMENEHKKLGDQVEDLIKTVVPKLAQKYKDCPSCKKRKEWLNNFNANVWSK